MYPDVVGVEWCSAISWSSVVIVVRSADSSRIHVCLGVFVKRVVRVVLTGVVSECGPL